MIDFIRRMFCEHEWEVILTYEDAFYKYKTYRCKKCGKSRMYRCG